MAHFEFQQLTLGGIKVGSPVLCKTVKRVILQCSPTMAAPVTEHLCEIARKTPDYPVDLCAWKGPFNDRRMVWTARIFYRNK